jgi:hypothetical protein
MAAPETDIFPSPPNWFNPLDSVSASSKGDHNGSRERTGTTPEAMGRQDDCDLRPSWFIYPPEDEHIERASEITMKQIYLRI